MKVIRARVLGFCSGVHRAVDIARQVSSSDYLRVYTLGPLIHNERVLESLRERGVVFLKEGEIPALPENSAVIIRAHGVPPVVERELIGRGITLIDATCPHVKISQGKAKDFAERAYRVFLAGEEKHAEVEGIRGYVEDVPGQAFTRCFVVSNPLEAEAAAEELYRREPEAKTALIGQTTIREEEYRLMGEKIWQFFPSLEIADTICAATAERQKALRELCADVNALIIVGSGESANTKRLLALAGEMGKPAWLVETPADVPAEIGNYETIGLSAGASTPDSLITEVEKALARVCLHIEQPLKFL